MGLLLDVKDVQMFATWRAIHTVCGWIAYILLLNQPVALMTAAFFHAPVLYSPEDF